MTKKFLIVSKEIAKQESLSTMLLMEEYGILQATDGQSALDTLESEKISVALVSLEAIRYNAHDYILKPFDPEEILASITKALARLEREAHPVIGSAA